MDTLSALPVMYAISPIRLLSVPFFLLEYSASTARRHYHRRHGYHRRRADRHRTFDDHARIELAQAVFQRVEVAAKIFPISLSLLGMLASAAHPSAAKWIGRSCSGHSSRCP